MPVPAMAMWQAAKTAAAGSPFNPQTDITWHSDFWAEGSAFTALGLSDGAAVTPWPNETGEADLVAVTGSPVFTAADALMGGRPTVTFDSDEMDTAVFSTAPDYTAGVSFVVVCRFDNVGGDRYVFDTNAGRTFVGNRSGGTSGIFAGAVRTGGLTPTIASLWVAHFDGGAGNDSLFVNGELRINTNAGSNQVTTFNLGGGANFVGAVAFAGIYEGDITADGSWGDFETWVSDHYGITIA